ncbi:S1C family serine protease [Aureispira anguillae]|uniref:Serine protease n=1 Tax=Aureispira anguillae TaxID=2864201 RepID=A0A915YC01_9BACT|nr:serine protease [Aureispira anguillae]BDS10290.1 serine protease [Aureispira anguillae]
MKNIFINLIFLVSSFTLAAQQMEYAKINFISYHNSSKKIYINDHLITAFGGNDILKLKIYSKGRFTVTMLTDYEKLEGVIEIKENKNYYFLVGYEKFENVPYRFSEIPEEAYAFFLKRFEKKKKITYNILEMEEDISKPIGKLDESLTQREKQGTGFLINSEGYVVTNFHVIDGAKNITAKGVKGDYNTPFQLEVVAVDRQLDLALLKINTKLITFEAPPYSIGNSKSINQASDVFTLGYPMKSTMGNEIKVTTGIINSTSGYKGSISEFQISASVQPGNSGGPLLDQYGNIVGVVSAKIKSKEVDNVGYAIKSDYLTFFLEQIGNIEFKKENKKLKEIDLSSQVKKTSNFVYIIEAK